MSKKKPYQQLKHDYFSRMLHERGKAYNSEFVTDMRKPFEGCWVVEAPFFIATKEFSKQVKN